MELEKLEKFVLIFQPGIELDDFSAQFDQICRIVFYLGGVQLILEELQEYASPHQLPHWLKKLMLVGRHQNISVLFTSQRPGEINKTVLSQCAHLFCGNIFEGNDLRYISNFLDQDAKILKICRIENFCGSQKMELKKSEMILQFKFKFKSPILLQSTRKPIGEENVQS
ncbi:MAG: ATP-binding protein [Bdellovibrionaceae bacterium]|nr:ATP-binding protein [Pseudobdellovibrionaceae bacterium]